MGESIEVVDQPPTVGEQLPSVTFLCTAYRTERTVAGTIESVLRQTRSDWQLVVVDNGMSDEIAAIVGAYTDDPRISLVRQENQKLPGGVNAAGRQAHGRYLSVLNSDDEVEPTFVDRLAGFLDASPETAAVACDARFMADDGRALAQTHMGVNPRRAPNGTPVTLAELVDGFVPYYTAAVRRNAWAAVGGLRTDAPIVEDLALWIDLVTTGHTVHVLPDILAVYRHQEDSDSRGARGVEIIEASRERVITDAVMRCGRPEDVEALAVALPRSRHRSAVVRSRRLLFEDDVSGAREAARTALAERSDLRTRFIVWGLELAPGGVHRSYRFRAWLRVRVRRLAPRLPFGVVHGSGRRG